MGNPSNTTAAPVRECFPFYYSFKDALQELDKADRLAIYDGITNYAFFKVEPSFKTVVARACWKLIKPLLEKSQRNFENGSKGGAPKGSRNNPNGRRGKSDGTNQELTGTNRELSNIEIEKEKDIEKEKENDNILFVSENPKPHTQNRMQRPSVEEISAYMREKGELNSDDEAAAFFDHYESNGWRVGKNPMKQWRSAVGTWLRNKNNGTYGNNRQSNKPSQADNITRAQQFAFDQMERTTF